MTAAHTPMRRLARVCGLACLIVGAGAALTAVIAPLIVPALDPAFSPARDPAPLPADASLPYALLGMLVAIFGYGLMRLGRR